MAGAAKEVPTNHQRQSSNLLVTERYLTATLLISRSNSTVPEVLSSLGTTLKRWKMSLLLCSELAKQAVSEGSKAVARYTKIICIGGEKRGGTSELKEL